MAKTKDVTLDDLTARVAELAALTEGTAALLAPLLARPDERSLDERIAAVQLELEDVERRGHADVRKRDGSHAYSYDYILEADLMRAIRPLLAKQGVATYYRDEILRYEAGTATVRVWLTFAANGHERELYADGYAADLGDKAANKAKTSAVRYLLWKTFLQPSDEDSEQTSTDVVEAAKQEDSRRRAADIRAGDQTRRTDRATQDTVAKLIQRLSELSVELDEIHGVPSGRTLGLLDDAIQAEHGEPKHELDSATLVKIGKALSDHVESERASAARDALDYTPTEFALPR